MDSTPRRWVLKPLSPMLHSSHLRTIAGPSQDDTRDLEIPVFSSESILITGNNLPGAAPPQKSDGSPDIVSQDRGSIGSEWLPSSSSNPSSPSSSLGSHSGFYSFVEDPASLEAELNEVWMVSPQRQTQLHTLKEEKEFKLQTYSSSRKPESLFSESEGDSQYKVDPEKVLKVVGQEEEKLLRKEIISSQAPKKNPVFKDQLPMLENLDLSSSKNKLKEGSGMSHSPDISRPETHHPAESGRIDKEHISFSAARQQFLKMEQDQVTAVLSSLRSSRAYLTSSMQQHPNNSVEMSEDMTQFKLSEADEMHPERTVTVGCTKDNLSVLEELDSSLEELSVEVGGGYTSDKVLLKDNKENQSCQSIAEYETPVGRETRSVQESEANLRRCDSRVEMTQIKPICLLSSLRGQYTPQQVEDLKSKNEQQHDNRKNETPQPECGQTNVFLSPCCPHRHPGRTEVSISKMSSDSSSFTVRDLEIQGSSGFLQPQMTSSSFHSSSFPSSQKPSPLVWSESPKTSGLQSRGQQASEFIEKEIKEAMRREQELKKVRESMVKTNQQPFSPTPRMEQASKITISHFHPPANTDKPLSLSSSCPRLPVPLSSMTSQPWTYSPPPASPPSSVVAPSTHPPLKDTLLQGFKDRRVQFKLDENSYAGIQLTDKVNNEVVKSTRVTRHKNQRALWWEAGVFANQDNQKERQDKIQDNIQRCFKTRAQTEP